ncbi:MAG: hypothetical protein LBT02_02020 [Rickettsiales bacterium]|jgi:hypothetical protein|nr:hypothetical protein [Rickettsiales bacterium]
MLNTYNVYLLHKDNKVEETLFIKVGFDIFSFIGQIFLFTFVYLAYRELYRESVTLFVISVLMIFCYPVNVVLAIFLGIKINKYYSIVLLKRGYQYLGYAKGRNVTEAKENFRKEGSNLED